ncbi:MAG: hypothetical protein VXW70_02615 [Candidatus Thermoplasmatota archaeon]|nr:hypothetical protein [Candidatus Thermoplasmatota archaeon]
MKLYLKSVSLMIVALFLGSIALTIVADNSNLPTSYLDDESNVSNAQSPGHTVFTEYVGAHWCGPCHGASNAMHDLYVTNGGGGSQSEDYTYISFYESASSGWPNDAPINRRAHINPSYYPTMVWGDATSSSSYYTSNTNTANFYQNGGNMDANAADYSITVFQSENGNMMDIDITAAYTGSGTKTVTIYAAVTEDTSPESYDGGGPNPHHVFRQWLLNGVGNAFESVTLTGGNPVTKSWSIPISVVRPGGGNSAADNFLTVAALLDGDHTTNRNVLAAGDSHMGPKMDLAVSGVTLSNPASADGYIIGDQVTVTASAVNVGGLDYSNGGNLEIIYMDGNNPIVVSSKQLTNLPVQSSMSHTASVDTSSLPTNAWSTAFGARLSGLAGDGSSRNNIAVEDFSHDRPPLAKQATVSGENVIERGSIFTVVAKGGADDYVDTIQSMTFELEVSPAGMNNWDGSIDSGGETIVNEGTSNEGREYTMTPSLTMPSGTYDLRSKTIDGRGQASAWRVTPNAFSLANGIPQVIAEPVPTVTCDVETEVDMTPHISDPETPLYDLVIDSDSPYFVSWNPLSSTISVNFEFNDLQGCPLGQKSMLVTVDDGGDYGNEENLPYGTLKFNVIENGQPRWLGLPTQTIDEEGPDSDGTLRLQPYITDTTADGQPSSSSSLSFDIVSETNPGIISSQIINGVLGFEAIGTDSVGQTTLTIRACDTDMECSDQTIVININPVNDAPVIDMSSFDGLRIKTGSELSVDLESLVSDVDNDNSELTVIVNSPDEAGGAQYNRQTGMLKLQFSEIGYKNVVIKVVDLYSSNEYTAVIEAYDSDIFTIAKSSDEPGFMVVEASNLYVGMLPYVNFYLAEDAPLFTSIQVTWQTCSADGVCDGIWVYDLDMTKSATGWETPMNIPIVGDLTGETMARGDSYNYGDYFKVRMSGVDNLNNNYNTPPQMAPKWLVTQEIPPASELSDEMLETFVELLENKIANLNQQISDSPDADTAGLELELIDAQFELELACQDPRVECTQEQASGTSIDSTNSGSNNTMMIFGIVALIVICALLGGMFLLRGRDSDEYQGFQWANTTLPASDAVANSMYGGAQQIFQQPLQTPQYAQQYQPPAHSPQYQDPRYNQRYAQQPQPVTQPAPPQNIPQVPVHRGPPLPPGGLPAGWSMDQWEYYGQQYLDRQQ